MSTVEPSPILSQPEPITDRLPTQTKPIRGEPTWGVTRLYPRQGYWTEAEYLALPDNRWVELSDGFLEFLPMPTMSHQETIVFLLTALRAFAMPRGLGKTLFAGLLVKLRAEQIREPDVVFMLAQNAARMGQQYWDGADLVMEVVSEDRNHDLVTKRQEYAGAGIAEYWIVDPREQTITVLALEGSAYVEVGIFAKEAKATSRLLPGFEVDVTAAFMPA